MSEFRLDIKTSGDDAPIKNLTNAQEQLNQAVAEGLALPINQELTAEQDAFNDLANAAAEAGNSVEEFVEKKKRATEVSLKDAFDPAAGLGSGAPDLNNLDPDGFKFSTLQEVEATEKAVEALKRKIAVTQAAGESVTKLALMLDVLSTALQTEEAQTLISARTEAELTDAQKEATLAAEKADAVRKRREESEGVKELVKQKRDWRSIIQGLTMDIPGLSHAASLLTNPLAAAGSALALVVVAYRKALKDIEESATSVDFSTLNRTLDEQRQIFGRTATAIADLNNSLTNIAAGDDPLIKRFKDATAAARELEVAQIALLDKKKALAYEKINAATEGGTMSAEAGIRAKQKIDETYIRDAANKKTQAEDREIKDANDQIKALTDNAPILETAIEKLNGQMRKLESESKQAADNLKRLEKPAEKGEGGMFGKRPAVDLQSINSVQLAREQAERDLVEAQKPSLPGPDDTAVVAMARKESDAKSLEQAKTNLAQLLAKENELKANKERLEALRSNNEITIAKIRDTYLKRATSDLANEATEIKNLQDRLAKLKKNLPALRDLRDEGVKTDLETSAVKNNSAVDGTRKAKEKSDATDRNNAIQNLINDGGGPRGKGGGGDLDPDRSKDFTPQIEEGLKTVSRNTKAMGDVVVAGIGSLSAAQERSIARLAREIATLKSQVANRRV